MTSTESTESIRHPKIAPGTRAIILLLALILVGWGGSLYAIYQNNRASACQYRAVQHFDAAISARAQAGGQSNMAFQRLIVTVFTPQKTRAAQRDQDLAAYATWHRTLAHLESIRLPPLPATACG